MSEGGHSDLDEQDADFFLRNELTKRYFEIAREHVETLKRITAQRSYPVPGPATDAAAVVTVFATIAAESAVNQSRSTCVCQCGESCNS